MPSYYWFHCSGCDWRQRRYRNLKRCSICGADAIREEPVSEVEQLRIKATELQARLDTHRQQTAALVRERDELQSYLDNALVALTVLKCHVEREENERGVPGDVLDALLGAEIALGGER